MVAAGGGAGQSLQEVHGSTFTGQQASGRTCKGDQQLVGRHLFTFFDMPFDGDFRIDLPEHFIKPWATTNHSLFTTKSGGQSPAAVQESVRR